ncbi:hypothetical protein llap_10459 [Limosa lapponica baueri]|uniref:Uncharacterized protein n=1 Tax=Limosa lapponica baueri TaxID=1758121 RepID=A0A2I0TZH4_LIMLA|nr:hypothetical protein llap_10459 [Limosa lapponica baueri]
MSALLGLQVAVVPGVALEETMLQICCTWPHGSPCQPRLAPGGHLSHKVKASLQQLDLVYLPWPIFKGDLALTAQSPILAGRHSPLDICKTIFLSFGSLKSHRSLHPTNVYQVDLANASLAVPVSRDPARGLTPLELLTPVKPQEYELPALQFGYW